MKWKPNVHQWDHPQMTTGIFFTPSPLVQNSCNLPYFIFFWVTPLPLPLRTAYVDGVLVNNILRMKLAFMFLSKVVR